MPNCPKCNSFVKEGQKFCTKCGTNLMVNVNVFAWEKRKDKTTIVVVIISVSIVIILAISAISFLIITNMRKGYTPIGPKTRASRNYTPLMRRARMSAEDFKKFADLMERNIERYTARINLIRLKVPMQNKAKLSELDMKMNDLRTAISEFRTYPSEEKYEKIKELYEEIRKLYRELSSSAEEN
ncbi:MAG: zinc ribbon domain-containing protein [candidate division WOR-3 bacterium]